MEKLHYDSSLSEFFSLVRKERKGQKEESIDSRLGDAVQRWLRHPEPSSWSRKSTPFLLKKKLLRATAVARFLLFAKRKKQECQNIPAFFIIISLLP